MKPDHLQTWFLGPMLGLVGTVYGMIRFHG